MHVGKKFRRITKLPWTRKDGTKGVEVRTAICVITFLDYHRAEFEVETIESVTDPLDPNVECEWTGGGFSLSLMHQFFKVEWL